MSVECGVWSYMYIPFYYFTFLLFKGALTTRMVAPLLPYNIYSAFVCKTFWQLT